MKIEMRALLLLLLPMVASAHHQTAFFRYDYVSGMNRVCVYDHLGSDYAITIKAYEVCPVTVKVRHD